MSLTDKSRGSLVSIGDFDHATVVYHAVPLVQEWFGRLTSAG